MLSHERYEDLIILEEKRPPEERRVTGSLRALHLTRPLKLLTPLAKVGSGDSSGLPQAPKKVQEVNDSHIFRGLFQAKRAGLAFLAAHYMLDSARFLSAWR